jgi:hypothetical protein
MPRRKFKNIGTAIRQMASDFETLDMQGYIPDIVTFCENSEYLGLTERGIKLRPLQKIVLKIFYRGSYGNENVTLTEEELELCKRLDLNNDDRGNIIDKYNSNAVFRELVLVWGRGGGKDFVISIIACYEAMRLLECPGGNPYKIYNLSDANPISILTVATAAPQAEIAFREIKDKVQNGKYFNDKIDIDAWQQNQIFLLTPQDKAKNKELHARGIPSNRGSIAIKVGHSNSDSLLGDQIFVLLLDEVASYKQTKSSSSGERILTALTPSLNRFVRTVIIKDASGNEITKKVFDSKLVCIASPRGEDGVFYNLFKTSKEQADRLSLRLAAWEVNPDVDENSLRTSNSQMTPDQFNMEFGACFSGVGGQNFFIRENVEACFNYGLTDQPAGKAGIIYFAHLDPARNSHNYALVVVHKECFLNTESHKTDFNVIVDHIKFWSPEPDRPIDVEEVDEYVIGLKRRFYLGMVTYDAWNSQSSIMKMRKHGIPAKMTHFTRRYQMIIYDELEKLINSGRLHIPHHVLLKNEMFGLLKKYTPDGYKIYPKRESGFAGTDDILDAMAGACYSVTSIIKDKLPGGRTVNTGSSPESNSRLWQSMSGPLGYGTGQQVADALEKRRFPQFPRR